MRQLGKLKPLVKLRVIPQPVLVDAAWHFIDDISLHLNDPSEFFEHRTRYDLQHFSDVDIQLFAIVLGHRHQVFAVRLIDTQ